MPTIIRPPGPENRGIIGNMPLARKDPLGTYANWRREFGKIFYYRALNRHVYFLNDPEMIKFVLLTNYQNFIKGEVLRSSRSVFGNGLLTSEGAAWLRQRRLIQPAFHRERINSYAQTMVACAERMISLWQNGETRDIHEEMMALGLEIVTRALFQIDIAEERASFAAALNTILEFNSGARMLLPPFFRRMPTPSNLRYKRAVGRLDEIVYELIPSQRSDTVSGGGVLVDLLQARDAENRPMTDLEIRDEVMTLLLAGHETTAVSLSWIWYLLAKHPIVEEKLWSELDGVLAGRDPQLDDVPNLIYTECVVKEGMRLYPPVWALVRTPIKDCEIAGYHIAAGSNVVMSQWVVHRDTNLYDAPESFDPGRWLSERVKALPKFAYFPFGGGPRSCIGSSFAMMEAILVLAKVAQRYQLRLVENQQIEARPSITLRPKAGIRVEVLQRTAHPAG